MEPTELDDAPPAAGAGFPLGDSRAEQLRYVLRYAALSPSTRNTQPWRFRIVGDALELHADRSRALPVLDPRGRELMMSCGAALLHVRVALRTFGHEADVTTVPDGTDGDLVARVTVGASRPATRDDYALFRAMPRRHTHRGRFEARHLPPAVLGKLASAAEAEGALLRPLTGVERRSAADLVVEGHGRQWRRRDFRRELATWTRDNLTRRGDGLPGYALGLGDLASRLLPLAVSTLDLRAVRRVRRLALEAPLLVVLATREDDAAAWLAAGQATARVLLRANVEHLSASFLNQAIQEPELRGRFAEIVGATPQLLLRVGYAGRTRATPRRAVQEIVNP